jgi:hypothetical protein
MTVHFDLIHMNIRPCMCEHCKKWFHNEEDLKVHENRVSHHRLKKLKTSEESKEKGLEIESSFSIKTYLAKKVL